jgi:hypothetical protein
MRVQPWYKYPLQRYAHGSADLFGAKISAWAMEKGYTYCVGARTPPTLRPLNDVIEALGRMEGRILFSGGTCATAVFGPGWVAYVDGMLASEDPVVYGIEVWAKKREVARTVAKRFVESAPPAPVKHDEVHMTFVAEANGGVSRHHRLVTAQAWSDIRSNYAHKTVQELDRLVAYRGDHGAGKAVIVRGAPGTGKTHFLLSLAREWAEWANVTYVSDPEKFFGSASYLHSCLMKEGDGSPDDEKFDAGYVAKAKKRESILRVFLMEDVDEFISADSKLMVGQGLGRLLNLVDGILGVGLRILLVLSTNEDISKLHKALVRPGRCMTNVEFLPLPAVDADAWRASHDLPPIGKTCTLAELYAALRAKSELSLVKEVAS